jgi:hypothetical protein
MVQQVQTRSGSLNLVGVVNQRVHTMVGQGTAVTGVGGVFLTTLLGSSLLDGHQRVEELNLPVFSVNYDKALLSRWVTEEIETYNDDPLTSECNFFNFSQSYTGEFCDAFTISRMQPGTLSIAASRALKCAVAGTVECVLSPEVGFATPAAFLATHGETDAIRSVIAPRVLPNEAGAEVKTEFVRISQPSGGTFSTRTIKMNTSINIEYMDDKKQIRTQVFEGNDAYCINLLRFAFETSCWNQLDG